MILIFSKSEQDNHRQWFTSDLSSCHSISCFLSSTKPIQNCSSKKWLMCASESEYTVKQLSLQTSLLWSSASRWASKLPGPFSTELFHQDFVTVSSGKTSVTYQLSATGRIASTSNTRHRDSRQMDRRLLMIFGLIPVIFIQQKRACSFRSSLPVFLLTVFCPTIQSCPN